jgi:hypothetical protein
LVIICWVRWCRRVGEVAVMGGNVLGQVVQKGTVERWVKWWAVIGTGGSLMGQMV